VGGDAGEVGLMFCWATASWRDRPAVVGADRGTTLGVGTLVAGGGEGGAAIGGAVVTGAVVEFSSTIVDVVPTDRSTA
jgi:hypothetical protein